MTQTDRIPGPIEGIAGVLKGVWTVFTNGFKPRVTRQVPEEKLDYPTRTTGRVFLDLDACIGCTLCEQICPNGTIKMATFAYGKKEEFEKKYPNRRQLYPSVDVSICTHCNLCEEICPTGAITLEAEVDEVHFERGNMRYTPLMLSKKESELWEGDKK
ncbi:MAG: 4Fe-4S binding protein [Candidatus Thermoplasmatota archaeon]|jgi:NADH-quinone oxidoreductase subunit I|nr:4Fe-4S binding protein [Candidatus Thermoplasmatota archaeon]MCL5681354.1 4Fe-4S binding protein [Candidatus Thermoplasmatota archaeon]